MLFNSVEFILIFLPVSLALFFSAPRFFGGRASIFILIISSLIFYAYWSVTYTILLVVSIFVNYKIGKVISRVSFYSKYILFLGVFLNLLCLGYYKYTGFIVEQLFPSPSDGGEWALNIVLPLAISFYTFQQISYLVDSYRRKSYTARFEEYVLFVVFFPQLIAGPIVRQDDVIPQYQNKNISLWDGAVFSTGVALFSCGLFKKVVVADQLALSVAPVFSSAAAGNPVQFFEGWIGALSYTFQIYFDFSGYADMAVGLGLMFGIRLPINFLSPYKSRSIIEFWGSWHITLSRFLREYVYIPLGGNRLGHLRKYGNISVVMLLGGVWHGAGWQFIVWGGLHGAMIVLNHFFRDQGWTDYLLKINRRSAQAFYYVVTFLGVVVAWVFFRAESLEGAFSVLSGMFGLNGVMLSPRLVSYLPDPITSMPGVVVAGLDVSWLGYVTLAAVPPILGAWIWCLSMPSSNAFFGLQSRGESLIELRFSQSAASGAITGGMFLICVFLIASKATSEFLYFQF